MNARRLVYHFKKQTNIMKQTESQRKRILNHLKKGKSITPIEALNNYGCFRLGARIHELRNQGYNIVTDTLELNGKRFAQYFLKN